MVVHLTGPWTVALDFLAWFAIHVGVSYAVSRPSADRFDPDSRLYRERRWERDRRIYEGWFRVKKWKWMLPDGAAVFRSGFRKKRLSKLDTAYVTRFVQEACRAELTHWLILAFAVVFFIWNVWWVGLIMILYAVLVNVPCIITQRYNRIRLRRVLSRHPVAESKPT